MRSGGGGNQPLRLTLALLALAAVAAIIAADFTTPAQAQSDETAGRIVARQLEDGRVEFGWQPASGARVLPRQRYFPTDATVDRWLRSSPVEVGGAEIGRINARLLGDGRIEFAFTPTDGERIAPQARYFPADARVGRWLRSTEITIGPPEDAATGFTAISARRSHTCAIRTNGEIECWGKNGYYWERPATGETGFTETGQADAPPGNFRAVAAGWNHTCAIRDTGEIACWGDTLGAPPEGSYTAIAAGDFHTCAIRASSGEIECWGEDHNGQIDAPEGSYIAISAGYWQNCAIRANSGEIECWGWRLYEQSAIPTGSFTAVSAGWSHACGLRGTGEIVCWGGGTAPAGSFTAVSAGFEHACGLRESGEITCWGLNFYGATDPPNDRFTAVSAGHLYTCAIRDTGAISCWGISQAAIEDADPEQVESLGHRYVGQTDPPPD